MNINHLDTLINKLSKLNSVNYHIWKRNLKIFDHHCPQMRIIMVIMVLVDKIVFLSNFEVEF